MSKEEVRQAHFCFIVGRGRSGTSLFQTILNTHPEISIPPECQFIMFLYNKYRKASWKINTIEAFYEDLWKEARFENWTLSKPLLKEKLLSLKEEATFAELCKTVYAVYAELKGKDKVKVIGDKNPHYALYIKKLMNIYPGAKFIHIVRDYRDTILSFKDVNFDPNNTIALAYRWNQYNKAILKYSEKYPDQFLLIRFEDLLSYPEDTLQKVCSFLEVPYTTEMLEFYKKEPEWDTGFRRNLKKPLDKTLTFKWKKRMKEKDIRAADFLCKNLAKRFNYETKYVRTSPLKYGISLPGIVYAIVLTMLERMVYMFPLIISARLISFYRFLTKE